MSKKLSLSISSTSSSASDSSSRDRIISSPTITPGVPSFNIDAGIEKRPPRDEESGIPLPAFLRQTRSDLRTKFMDLEWQQRERLHDGIRRDQQGENVSQWARMKGEEVAERNRYMNVDPYSSNRIRLRVPEGQNDYINASPIKLPTTADGPDKYFIATQGPKEASYSHIWRMIWDETADPAVIVMLTQTHESGREKCFQYFPANLDNPVLPINEEDEFGDGFKATLTLKSIQEDGPARTTIRELELKKTDGRSKTVWHLLFSVWPDFLVPEGDDRDALLRLIKISQEKNLHPESPRTVHCSAGVGRSGTFIALDWLLAELDAGRLDNVPDDEDPIANLVDKLRQQRMMMVQGDQQFSFMYDVLREHWVERWKRISS